MENEVKIVDILFGKKAVSLLVAEWFYDIKLFLPETDQRLVYSEHIGYFPDPVINFFYFLLFVRHVVKINQGFVMAAVRVQSLFRILQG